MTPKLRLVPETPTSEMVDAGMDPVIYSAALEAAPPMDYISGEEIRKLIEQWRKYEGWSMNEDYNSGEEVGKHEAADELEKLLKGEGQ